MTRVERSADCGNSPKNLLVEDLAVAIARADVSRISAIVTSDVRWLPVGGKSVSGAEEAIAAITREGPATRVTIGHVVTHGKAGAVDGLIEFGRTRRGFCHLVEFASARAKQVSQITSYVIELG